MNKLEKDKLRIFVQDTVLYNTVKRTLLSSIGEEFNFNDNLADEVIGQKTRARKEALKLLTRGFRELERYRQVETNNNQKINEAR